VQIPPLPKLLVACLGLVLAGPAVALPVTHTLTTASSFTAELDIAGTWTAHTSLGDASGGFAFGGTLSGTPTGEADLEWGSPGWDGTLAVPSFDIQASNLGTIGGTTGFNLFGLLPVTLGIAWSVDSLALSESSSGILSGAVANPPGDGPWAASGSVPTHFSASNTLTVTFLGLGSPTTLDPFDGEISFPSATVELERTGGFPGSGSKASLDFDVAGPIALFGSDPIPRAFPGCDVQGPFGLCVFDVQGLTITFTKSDLSDFSLSGAATSSVGIVPEPATGLLLGTGLAALARRRRRAPAGPDRRRLA